MSFPRPHPLGHTLAPWPEHPRAAAWGGTQAWGALTHWQLSNRSAPLALRGGACGSGGREPVFLFPSITHVSCSMKCLSVSDCRCLHPCRAIPRPPQPLSQPPPAQSATSPPGLSLSLFLPGSWERSPAALLPSAVASQHRGESCGHEQHLPGGGAASPCRQDAP